MIDPRPSLAFTVLLSLAACAPGEKDDGERSSNPGWGFELASAEAGEFEAGAVIELSAEDLRNRMAAGDVRLIDVRTDGEVAEGVIPGAKHIALDDFNPARLNLDDASAVVLYCRSGRRSRIAGKRLADHTGHPARHLAGGITAWEAAGGPVVSLGS